MWQKNWTKTQKILIGVSAGLLICGILTGGYFYLKNLNIILATRGFANFAVQAAKDQKSNEISFREIRKVPAFDGDAKRLDLLHRLNQVPGISLSSDSINRYPTILLSVLKDDSTLNQFLGVFDWVIQEIKSSV